MIESKSLKLYLWGFREKGIFAEDLAATLLKDLVAACDQWRCVWILSSKCGANSRFGLLSAIQAVSRSASQPVSKGFGRRRRRRRGREHVAQDTSRTSATHNLWQLAKHCRSHGPVGGFTSLLETSALGRRYLCCWTLFKPNVQIKDVFKRSDCAFGRAAITRCSSRRPGYHAPQASFTTMSASYCGSSVHGRQEATALTEAWCAHQSS